MLILGIDPSIVDLGYALLDGQDLQVVGRIRTSPKDEYTVRLRHIYYNIEAFCKVYKPDAIAIETQYIDFGKISNAVLKVTEVKGVCEGAYWSNNASGMVLEINPKSVKAHIGLGYRAKRAEAKEASVAWVQEHYPKSGVTNNNESDAVVIALCAEKLLTSAHALQKETS